MQIRFLPRIIFWSRWLQAPLYLGLILVLGVYVYEFGLGLFHLISELVSPMKLKSCFRRSI